MMIPKKTEMMGIGRFAFHANGRGNRQVRSDKRRLIGAVLPVDPVVIEARSAEENLGGLGPGHDQGAARRGVP